MAEIESAYKAKIELYNLLEKQREVERDILKYHEVGDGDTAEILQKRYNDLNIKIFDTAQTFINFAKN